MDARLGLRYCSPVTITQQEAIKITSLSGGQRGSNAQRISKIRMNNNHWRMSYLAKIAKVYISNSHGATLQASKPNIGDSTDNVKGPPLADRLFVDDIESCPAEELPRKSSPEVRKELWEQESTAAYDNSIT